MGLNDVVGTTGPGPGGTGNTSIRSYNFWLDTTIAAPGTYATNAYSFNDPDGTIGFLSNVLQFINDSSDDIWFSFDGVHDHGRIEASETVTQPHRRMTKIWFRGTAGDAFRFWAY